jgi:hypothetical protein
VPTEATEYVIGLFRDHDQARAAIEALSAAGYGRDDMSLLMPTPQETEMVARQAHATATEGARSGYLAGGMLGGATGLLLGLVALTIPGIGPLVGGGVLLAALGGTAVGATVGGLTGALIGMGLPEETALQYEEQLRQGAAIVSVHAPGRRGEAESLLRSFGAFTGVPSATGLA